MKVLLDNGANVDVVDNIGYTALSISGKDQKKNNQSLLIILMYSSFFIKPIPVNGFFNKKQMYYQMPVLTLNTKIIKEILHY